MKKLLFVFGILFFAVGISTVSAQTSTCTPAQKAACKKICSTSTSTASCTPAQKAACKKVCDNNSSTKVALTEKLTNPFVNVSTDLKEKKSTSCSPSKLTKGTAKSCSAKKTKLVKNEQPAKAPIAQTVAIKSGSEQ